MKTFSAISLRSGLLLSVAASLARADFQPTTLSSDSPKTTIVERRKEVESFHTRKLEISDQIYEQMNRNTVLHPGFPWELAAIFFAGMSVVCFLVWWRGQRKPQSILTPNTRPIQRRHYTTPSPQSSDGAGALFTAISMLKPSKSRRRHHHRHHHRHRSRHDRHNSQAPHAPSEDE